MRAIGINREDLIKIVKTIGQNIIDNAEDIAPDSVATNSVRITGEIIAGEIVRLNWQVWKYVMDEGRVILSHESEIEVGE